ncbi:lysophospholipase [Acetobacter sp. TBRC 12305]|uniref:Alpha/beta fold hydrolase n=1 Tax=Acetobacter garciniae TaxID=2817435 RepID=A0A939KQH1_9PROT|nr:alpha/beta fold hydrolase [Acetobacter garciniae]MBO1325389.1 alpha/beta fold hydrolase [Acetobacter garciniae]MBX0345439.1 lysophospholipase [Acetobacter garciniae]
MIRIPVVVVQLSSLPMRVSGWPRRGARMAALALAGWLGGCAAVPAHAPVPPPRFAAAARLVPPDRVFILSDGAALPARVWSPATAPRAVILALHGFNDSRDAWEFPAPFFTANGVRIVAPDQRGFGGAPDRGGWAGSARMVADIREELAILARENPGVPLYLAGESMGGAVAMLLMASPDAPHIAGTILLAPAVWALGPGADVPLNILATMFPHRVVTGRELPVHVVASDNLAALIRLYYDPLSLRETQLATLRGLVNLMRDAAEAAPNLHGPILCVYGDRDALVPPAAMGPVWRAMAMHGAEASGPARLDLIPGGYHLLLRGRNSALVEGDILRWMTQPGFFLPSGGDVAAAAWLAQDGGDTRPGKAGMPWFLPARLDQLTR